MNQVALVGRMTKDPVLRKFPDGGALASFTVAVNRTFRNQKGEYEADFVFCSTRGRTAENTAQYCQKGSLIAITGRIQSRSYEREDGSRAFVTEVSGDEVRFLETKRRGGSGANEPDRQADREQAYVRENFELTEKEKEELPIF